MPRPLTTLVLVADTHSHPHPDAQKHIAALAPDFILHAGDIGDIGVIDALATIAPVHAVRGNIDGHEGPSGRLPDSLSIDVVDEERPRLRIFLTHIAVNGPRLRADAVRGAVAEGASMVVCGHSHVPFIGRDRGLLVFNPGSIGPRRFQLPIVFGVIEIRPTGIAMRHVSCETGSTWEPSSLSYVGPT
jgi:putative phosphoesterase